MFKVNKIKEITNFLTWQCKTKRDTRFKNPYFLIFIYLFFSFISTKNVNKNEKIIKKNTTNLLLNKDIIIGFSFLAFPNASCLTFT